MAWWMVCLACKAIGACAPQACIGIGPVHRRAWQTDMGYFVF